MNAAQKGFTLIELMIVIAIIGILAAIAIPAYTDYTARAKITEAVTALASAKTSVSEYYTSMGKMPADAAEAGITTDPAGSYVAEVTYSPADGTDPQVATVTAKIQNVNGTADGKFFYLEGTGTDKGIEWTCGTPDTDGLADKYLPANCRAAAAAE